MKTVLWIIAVLAVFAVAWYGIWNFRANMGKPQLVRSPVVLGVRTGEAVLLDVRSNEEWQAGHADGALHWELSRLEKEELPDIPKNQKIYIYCRTGQRAEVAKKILEQNGYQDLVNLGGLKDWESFGGEVVKF